MDYKIPKEVLDSIPEYFWWAFAGELVSVFSTSIFVKDEFGQMGLYFISGTIGWNAALKMTCHKLYMDWLYEYYEKLEWWESDMFDDKFEDLLVSKFVHADRQPEDSYYSYLMSLITVDKNDME